MRQWLYLLLTITINLNVHSDDLIKKNGAKVFRVKKCIKADSYWLVTPCFVEDKTCTKKYHVDNFFCLPSNACNIEYAAYKLIKNNYKLIDAKNEDILLKENNYNILLSNRSIEEISKSHSLNKNTIIMSSTNENVLISKFDGEKIHKLHKEENTKYLKKFDNIVKTITQCPE